MTSAKVQTKRNLTPVKPTGTWTAPAPAEPGGKARPSAKARPGSVTVTILGTPLEPKHVSRSVLEAAVRAVK